MTHSKPATSASQARPASSTTRITVLVADDHPVVREGVANMIRQQADMEVVAEVADGVEAVGQWASHRPDVTLMDLRMPGLNGTAAIGRIREIDAGAKVIVLTTYESEEEIFRAMQAGAKSFLLKDTPRTELLDCIRRVSRGDVCLSGTVAAKLAARVALPDLTHREQQVLQLASDGRSNKQIAAALEIGDGTVKAHLKSVFAKLDAISRTEAVSIARRRGMIDA